MDGWLDGMDEWNCAWMELLKVWMVEFIECMGEIMDE
jgi:hypothetical protein